MDGKTLRGSRTRTAAAQHVLAASIDVDSRTNEITRFDALLDQIGDLRGVVVTVRSIRRGATR